MIELGLKLLGFHWSVKRGKKTNGWMVCRSNDAGASKKFTAPSHKEAFDEAYRRNTKTMIKLRQEDLIVKFKIPDQKLFTGINMGNDGTFEWDYIKDFNEISRLKPLGGDTYFLRGISEKKAIEGWCLFKGVPVFINCNTFSGRKGFSNCGNTHYDWVRKPGSEFTEHYGYHCFDLNNLPHNVIISDNSDKNLEDIKIPENNKLGRSHNSSSENHQINQQNIQSDTVLNNVQNNKSQVSKTIHLFSGICAGVAIQPIPFADIFILTPIQMGMGAKIAALHGVPIGDSDIKSIWKEIAGAIGMGLIAQQTVIGLYKTILPFMGAVTTIPLVYGLTFGIGKVMDQYFAGRCPIYSWRLK